MGTGFVLLTGDSLLDPIPLAKLRSDELIHVKGKRGGRRTFALSKGLLIFSGSIV